MPTPNINAHIEQREHSAKHLLSRCTESSHCQNSVFSVLALIKPPEVQHNSSGPRRAALQILWHLPERGPRLPEPLPEWKRQGLPWAPPLNPSLSDESLRDETRKSHGRRSLFMSSARSFNNEYSIDGQCWGNYYSIIETNIIALNISYAELNITCEYCIYFILKH